MGEAIVWFTPVGIFITVMLVVGVYRCLFADSNGDYVPRSERTTVLEKEYWNPPKIKYLTVADENAARERGEL